MSSPTGINTENTKVPEVMKIQYPSIMEKKVFQILSDCPEKECSYFTINKGTNNITYVIISDIQNHEFIKLGIGWIQQELLDILLDTTPTTTQEYLNLWDFLQDAESHRKKTNKRINKACVSVRRKQAYQHQLTDEEKALLIKYKYVKKWDDIKNLYQKFYEQAQNRKYLYNQQKKTGKRITDLLIKKEIVKCKKFYDNNNIHFKNNSIILEELDYSDFLQFLGEMDEYNLSL